MGKIQKCGTQSQEELSGSELERLEKVVRERTVQVRQVGIQLRVVSAGVTDKEGAQQRVREMLGEGATERGP